MPEGQVNPTAATPSTTATGSPTSLAQLTVDGHTWQFGITVSPWLAPVLFAVLLWGLFLKTGRWRGYKSMELDAAEIGVGSGKITLKPNLVDRQIAYAIWIELSTRKIGLPIDVSHDVIIEVYNSWYDFFSVTRDLLKTIPVGKVRQPDTRKIITVSMAVLNDELRPHLTSWQARFRHWYEGKLKADQGDAEPQKIQSGFPRYAELTADLQVVNTKLIAYRRAMEAIVFQS